LTPEADNLLHLLPTVVRSPDLTDWERKFCVSVIGAQKRRPCQPSEKQMGVLRRIVGAWKDKNLRVVDDAG
jgi:hypothetical protein